MYFDVRDIRTRCICLYVSIRDVFDDNKLSKVYIQMMKFVALSELIVNFRD